jgi:TonB family protein
MKKYVVTFFSVVILSLTLAVAADAQSDNDANNQQTGDRKLKIIKKPIPESGECRQTGGITMVRVTFDKSAKVTEATITQSSGCAAFDRNSLKSARAIKFEPQMKDGEAVTVVKPVEYKFYRY